MPNQPKTPISNFRLTDEDKERLGQIQKSFVGLSKTEAVREAIASLARSMANLPETMPSHWRKYDDRSVDPAARMCPLGFGHTAHVWELPDGPGHQGNRRHICYGQPFKDGYDPLDDMHHLNAYVTTNPPRVEWVDDTLKRSY